MIGLLEPIAQWEEWQADAETGIVTEVIFKKDFGPWKKGEEIECLTIVTSNETQKTHLQQTDLDGNVVKSVEVQLEIVT